MDTTLRIFSVDTGECTAVLRGHEQEVVSCNCTVNGTVVSGSFDKTVRVWDVNTGQYVNMIMTSSYRCMFVLKGHTHEVSHVDVDYIGNVAASSSADCTVRLWDIVNGTCLHELKYV